MDISTQSLIKNIKKRFKGCRFAEIITIEKYDDRNKNSNKDLFELKRFYTFNKQKNY